MSASRATFAGCIALLTCVVASSTATAGPTREDQGKALYEQGTAAMKDKQLDVACAKFKASYQVSGIPGALLSWADCEELRGHVATAFKLWNEGSALVIRDNERHTFVQQRIDAVSPRVPHVRIVVGSPDVKDVHATLDGAAVDARQPIAADPGEHALGLSADGFVDETASVTVDFGDTKDVHVFDHPRRAPDAPPKPPTASPSGPAPARGNGALRTAGWVTLGVGLLGAATFGATAGAVFSLCKGHLGQCPASQRSTVGALDIVNGVGLGVGIAGVATGAVLLGVGYGSSGARAPAAALYVGPSGAGLRGVF